MDELDEPSVGMLHRRDEFPSGASEWPSDLSRRNFLKLVGASLALAGLNSACNRQPAKQIVPYTAPPEAALGAESLSYASAFAWEGFARGILVTAQSGRPTKIEGNPGHPDSMGAADTFTQASILELYDPDRSRSVLYRGEPATANDFSEDWLRRRADLSSRRGRGLVVLTEPTTSPTLLRQLHALLDVFPEARWYQHSPLARRDRASGVLDYDFQRADLIFSLQADPLYFHPSALRYARDFAQRRRARNGSIRANRLYAVEAGLSITGSMADVRLPLSPQRWLRLLNAIATSFDGRPLGGDLSVDERRFVQSLVGDLRRHASDSLCLVGDELPDEYHRWAEQMNRRLGAYGVTLRRLSAVRSDADARCAGPLQALAAAIGSGNVDTLVIVESNPAYTSPADLQFPTLLKRVPHVVHFGLHLDETAAFSEWHVPASHYLESWSDLRAYDGTASVVQPLIEPMYATRSAVEFVHDLADSISRSGYELVRETWRDHGQQDSPFDVRWRQWLDRGIIENTTATPIPETTGYVGELVMLPEPPDSSAPVLLLQPDYQVLDGRWANNPWLQELPNTFTHLVWDNALIVSPAFARRYQLKNGSMVRLENGDSHLDVGVWVLPGHADASATLTLGYGRTAGGEIARRNGFNAYALRRTGAPWVVALTGFHSLRDQHTFVSTREHYSMERRDLVRTLPASQLHDFEPPAQSLPSLYPDHPYTSYAWAMVIDLSTCIGCNACVVACQAENNIPVVGKDQCARGREMHWLRVDRYYDGDENAPRVLHQPVPCMHCEQAPCELVCPVGATVHSAEGLNDMVYNRCVGTRYCSNNCPYKVRRFNFLDYRAPGDSPVYLQANPNVTVRERGVMEKCTYCVQRINTARIRAERENRRVRDGEIKTACQQSCPVDAIVFGDRNDPASVVAQLKKEKTNYGLLEELNTRPRTTYLSRILNPVTETTAVQPASSLTHEMSVNHEALQT